MFLWSAPSSVTPPLCEVTFCTCTKPFETLVVHSGAPPCSMRSSQRLGWTVLVTLVCVVQATTDTPLDDDSLDSLDTPSPAAAVTNEKVYGGQPVEEGVYPFLVSVRVGGRHVNVGTIIAPQFVLTEAWHYTNCSTPDCNVTVRAGSVNALKDGQVFEALEVIPHELYQNPHFDLALVKLASNFSGDEIAELPSPGQTWSAGTEAVTLAWGGYSSNVLAELKSDNVTVLENSECEQLENWYPEEQICVQGADPNQGLCDGDYGAPLVVNGTLVAGLNIFNQDCGFQSPSPDRFLDLEPHLTWILDQLHN